MARTVDNSEADPFSNEESDTDQEDEVLSLLYHFINIKHIY